MSETIHKIGPDIDIITRQIIIQYINTDRGWQFHYGIIFWSYYCSACAVCMLPCGGCCVAGLSAVCKGTGVCSWCKFHRWGGMSCICCICGKKCMQVLFHSVVPSSEIWCNDPFWGWNHLVWWECWFVVVCWDIFVAGKGFCEEFWGFPNIKCRSCRTKDHEHKETWRSIRNCLS